MGARAGFGWASSGETSRSGEPAEQDGSVLMVVAVAGSIAAREGARDLNSPIVSSSRNLMIYARDSPPAGTEIYQTNPSGAADLRQLPIAPPSSSSSSSDYSDGQICSGLRDSTLAGRTMSALTHLRTLCNNSRSATLIIGLAGGSISVGPEETLCRFWAPLQSFGPICKSAQVATGHLSWAAYLHLEPGANLGLDRRSQG